jgi:hypothetical protein
MNVPRPPSRAVCFGRARGICIGGDFEIQINLIPLLSDTPLYR